MRARTGTAQLPLHTGKAPRWLFSRMVLLAREISTHIVSEFGPEEMLRRLSDPFWFQAFGCVLGFDWPTLNLVADESEAVRAASAELARQQPSVVLDALSAMPALTMPRRHAVLRADVNPQYLQKILLTAYDRAPENFETLLGMEGVGARTLRALALVSEIIYGTPASTRDPARFSFAHGGKDGFPFPVDTGTYDQTVEVLRNAVTRAGIDRSERVQALKRLVKFGEERVRARQARPAADPETP